MIKLSQKTLWKKKIAQHKSLVKAPDIPVLFYFVYYIYLYGLIETTVVKDSVNFDQ